jgi:hypothetical protein
MGRYCLCQTKNSSYVPMPSLLVKKLYDMCVELMGSNQEDESKGKLGEGWASTVQDGAVDLQHGTRVDRNSHS